MRVCIGLLVAVVVTLLAGHAARAGSASFAVVSVTATPAAVGPGQTVSFTAAVTADQNATNYTIGFQVYFNKAYIPSGSTLFTGVTFQANKLVSKQSSWVVPIGASNGTYTVRAGVLDSKWNWITGAATTFTVSSATVNGQCGASNGADLTAAPSAGLCNAGTVSPVTGVGPWLWNCAGSNGGATAQCSAASSPPIKGACGAANGTAATGAPTTNLCGAGGASAITGSGPWYWTCAGSNGGTNAACSAPIYVASTDTPGLSPALSASPPYACVTNYYVDAVNGKDSNPGTQALPWQTIQNADNGYPNRPTPGECVNVLPGTYMLSQSMIFSHGGNSNSPTGYVVYRSTVPQAAHIMAAANLNAGADLIQLWAAYFIIDGFEIDGNHSTTAGSGINGCANGGNPTYNVAHHMIVINNIIHDMGGAGLSTCAADYITWEHNVVYNTSATDLYQVSGLDLWEPHALAAGSYTPTAADNVPYGIVIEYNTVYDNGEGPAIPAPHTDGNGIIVDTTFGSATCQTCGTPYPGKILVLGNLTYNNGGGGVHVFLSENVTVANNTSYNNYLDALNPGTARGELSSGGSSNITWINNVGYAVPGGGSLAHNGAIATFALTNFPVSGTWANNVTFGGPVNSDANDVVNPATNMIGVDPQLTNPPAGNFVPLAGSPVIGSGMPQSYLPSTAPDIGAY